MKAEGGRMKKEKGDGNPSGSSFIPPPSSLSSARVHIFWQRRIRAGDETTPYWFPSLTGGGAIGKDRIVMPIPPGTHWRDAKPLILPNADCRLPIEEKKQLPGSRKPKLATGNLQPATISAGGLRFATPESDAPKEKPKRQPKPKVKNDPKLVAAARELRDRWLEKVNSGEYLFEAAGKYDVGRGELPIAECRMPIGEHRQLLPAA